MNLADSNICNSQSTIRHRAEVRSPRPVLSRGRLLGVGIAAWLAALSLLVAPWNRCRAAETADAPFRVGFSSSMFTDIHENDARAAVRGWAQTVAKP